MSGSEDGDVDEKELNYNKAEISKLKNVDIEIIIVKCSACGKQVNHHDSKRVLTHPHLHVLICKDCLEFYGDGEFSQDEEGDKYCRWCAQGGQVFGCDFCRNVFCADCIRRNFGRGENRKIREDNWKCYMCDPSQIQEKVDFANKIIEYSKSYQKVKKLKKNHVVSVSLKNIDFQGDDPRVWLSKSCDYLASTSSKLTDRVNRMRKRISSKNTKYLVEKMDEIIKAHKKDLESVQCKLVGKFQEREKRLLTEPEICISDESQKEFPKSYSDKPNVNEHSNGKSNACKSLFFNENVKECLPSPLINAPKENLDCIIVDDEDIKEKFLERSYKEEKKTVSLNDIKEDNIEAVDISQCKDPEEDTTIIVKTGVDMEENIKESSKISDDATGKVMPSSPPHFEDGDDSSPGINDSTNVATTSDNMLFPEDENNAAKAKVLELSDSDDDDDAASDATTVPDNFNEKKRIYSSSDESTSDDSIASISTSKQVRHRRKPRKENRTSNFTSEDLIHSDKQPDLEKLKLKAVVVIKPLSESILKHHRFIAEEEEESSEQELETPESMVLDLESKVASLSNLSFRKSSSEVNMKARKEKEKVTPVKAKKSKATVVSDSDSVKFTSTDDDDDDDMKQKNFLKKPEILIEPAVPLNNINAHSKDRILDESSSSHSDIFSDSSDTQVKTKKPKAKVDSVKKSTFVIRDTDSEYEDPDLDLQDFVMEPKKGDKLLKVPIAKLDSGKTKEKKEKPAPKEKSKKRKRKILYSDDSSENMKDTSSSESKDSSSDDEKHKKKTKRRRRAKTLADDSSDERNKQSGDEASGVHSTPGKGRKNIRKVISDRKLTETTIEAQQAEKDRRKRISERQKLYNQITEKTEDGSSTVTRKMVLEVDPESKEEIVEIDPDLVEKLKPHQVNGVKFMWESTIESLKELESGKPGSGCILAHCMGLGKTLQVVTFVHTILTNKQVNKNIKTAMVICPYNTVLNWSNEFDYWLEGIEGYINVFDLNSVKSTFDRRMLLQNWQEDGGVLIIGYNIFSRLADGKIPKATKKIKTAIYECLCDPGPDVVVCDEGHLLKNECSALSKAAGRLKTLRRIVLTGTPLQNNLKEYHCMMHFVKPNLLGTSKEFLNRFVNPIINGQYDDSSKHDVKLMKKRVHILHKLLEGCVQRCDYSALTKFLPPKHEFVISVKLSELQIKLYRHYLDQYTRAGGKVDKGRLFQDYQVLKNIWTYPWILYPDFYRAEKRRLFKSDDEEDESFINDGSSSSESAKMDDDDVVDLDKPGPSKKNESSDDEVIRKYSTRARSDVIDLDNDGEENEADRTKHWWDDYFSEDDKFKIEMSGKMVLLLEIFRQCEIIGDKILLFSTSLLTLDMIEDLLEHVDLTAKESAGENEDAINKWVVNIDYFRMDGSTNVDLRKKWMKLFNDPNNERARLFLISTKAGSLGTNLVGANRVIIMDASWNPSHDVQAIFRVYRFGQIKPVYVYRLLAQGTMEEKIYKRQVTKLSLSCRVVDEQQIDRHFNAAQLSELYELDVATEHPTPMVPKDRLLADMLMLYKDWIVNYHEHDSLLQSSTEDDLTEEERQTAWSEYENEKQGIFVNNFNAMPEAGADQNKPYYGFPSNGNADIYIDVDDTVRSMINKLQREELSKPELYSKLLQFLINLLAFFKNKHRCYLVAKQQYIAAGVAVPPETSASLTRIQMNMEKVTTCISNAQKNYQDLMFQQSYSRLYQNRANISAAYVRPSFISMRYMPRPSAPRPAPSVPTNVPREKPTIVDITSENSSQSSATASNSVPVVTEFDDVSTPKDSQTTKSSSSSVEIMEIDD